MNKIPTPTALMGTSQQIQQNDLEAEVSRSVGLAIQRCQSLHHCKGDISLSTLPSTVPALSYS